MTLRGPYYIVADMRGERDADFGDNEVELAERAAAGDEAAFNTIVVRYYRPLLTYLTYRVHSAEVAEDLLQEIFFRLWRNPSGMPVDGNLRLYLYRAARNAVLGSHRDRQRAEQAMVKFSLAHTVDIDTVSLDTPLDTLEQRELVQRVTEAIDALPERAREVFLLHREQHLTYQEIAGVLGITPNTVKFHIGRAVAAIKMAVGPFLGVLLLMRL